VARALAGGGSSLGIITSAASALSSVASAAASGLSVAAHGLSTLLDVGRSIAQLGASITGAGLTALLYAVTTAIGTAVISIKSSLQTAREVLDISQRSGMGLGAAALARNNLSGFGVGVGDVPGLMENSMLQRMRGSVFGVRGEAGSNEWLSSFRAQYQSQASRGPLGLMMAQNMAKSLGAESLIPMANLSSGTFNRQMQRSQTMQQSFGLNPGEIRQIGQDFSLLSASASQFVSLFKDRVAGELIPYLTGALDKSIAYLSANSGAVSAAIKNGVSWLFEQMPPMLLRGMASGMRGVSGFLGSMESLTRSLASSAPAILSFIDAMLHGARDLMAFGVGATAAFKEMFGGATRSAMAPQGSTNFGAMGGTRNSLIPGIELMYPVASGIQGALNSDPVGAFTRAQSNFYKNTPEINTLRYGQSITDVLNSGANSQRQARQGLEGQANRLDSYADSWTRMLSEITQNTRQTASNTTGITAGLREVARRAGMTPDAVMQMINDRQQMVLEEQVNGNMIQ
jgi:hypothetical protein